MRSRNRSLVQVALSGLFVLVVASCDTLQEKGFVPLQVSCANLVETLKATSPLPAIAGMTDEFWRTRYSNNRYDDGDYVLNCVYESELTDDYDGLQVPTAMLRVEVVEGTLEQVRAWIATTWRDYREAREFAVDPSAPAGTRIVDPSTVKSAFAAWQKDYVDRGSELNTSMPRSDWQEQYEGLNGLILSGPCSNECPYTGIERGGSHYIADDPSSLFLPGSVRAGLMVGLPDMLIDIEFKVVYRYGYEGRLWSANDVLTAPLHAFWSYALLMEGENSTWKDLEVLLE
jgi:hypothetical protein